MRFVVFLSTFFIFLQVAEILAQSSPALQGINYQAVLAENGTALSNTSVSLRFSLWANKNVVYQEEQMVITDEQGQVSTQIGQGIATFGEFETLNWRSDPFTLKVELDTGNGFGEISNQPFQYVPYSFMAESVRILPAITMDSLTDVVAPRPAVGEVLKWDGKAWIPGNDIVASGSDAAVNTSARIEGDGSADNPLDLAQQGATEGQVLKWNGTSWIPADEEGGSGTSLGSGEGIQIIDENIVNTGDTDASDDLVQGSVAGGDLDGVFPNPRVARLQGRTVASREPSVGEILKWDGNAWVPASDNVAEGSDGAVNTSARLTGDGSTENPLDLASQNAQTGQVLKWNGTSWEPADDSVASGTQSSIFTSEELAGEGSETNPLTLASQDAEVGDILKWNGTIWKPSKDESGASLWNEPDSGEVSFKGKIGLNVDNPIFDIQSEGNFLHEGFFQVGNSSFPTMRIRHDKQDNIFPQAVQLQFIVSDEQGQGLMLYETSGFTFRTIDANNNRFNTYLRTNGRMGLGVSSPSERLDIDGAIKLGTTSSENEGTIRYTGSDFEGRKDGEWISLTQQGGGNSSSSPWSSSNGGQEIFTEKSQVGIGEAQPQELLHIHNSNSILGSPSNILITNSITASKRSEGLSIGVSNNVDGTVARIIHKEDGPLFLGAADESHMVINNKGFVGIGDFSPSTLLTVGSNNNATANGQFLVSQEGSGDAFMNFGLGNGSSYAMGIDNSDSDKFKMGHSSDGPRGLNTNPFLTFQTNGNMGLGTTSPDRKLTVSFNNNNQSTSQMLIEQRGSGDAFMNFSLDGGTSYALGIDNSDGDRFKIGYDNDSPNGVGNSTLFELDTSGNMEVQGEIRRTATGSANLVPLVMGKFNSNGVIVSSVSTNNFSVKEVTEGEFEITLNIDLPQVNFTSEVGLVLATVSGSLNIVNASVGWIGDDYKIFSKV